MKIKCLETHEYAPELNKLHFLGVNKTLPCPGIKTIKQAKEFLFKRVPFGKVVRIEKTNEKFSFLNKVYQAYFTDYKEILEFLKEVKKGNVENTKYTVKTFLRG